MDFAGWGEPRSDILCELTFTRFVEHYDLEDLGLSEYTKALKALLAEDNFERPLQLEQDTSQQDRLSTWIEYLGYEYWRYRWHSRTLERLQPEYDKAKHALVSGQYEADLLQEYQHTLIFYDETKQNKARHEAYWRWVRDQVPLVEAEMKAAKTKAAAATTPGSSLSGKEPAADDYRTAEAQTRKPTRRSKRSSAVDETATATPTVTRSKRLRNSDAVGEEPSSKRPRTTDHKMDASSSKAGAPTGGKVGSSRGKERENSTSNVADTSGRAGPNSKRSGNNPPSNSGDEPTKVRRSARLAARHTR